MKKSMRNSFRSIEACEKAIREYVKFNDVAAVCTENNGKSYYFVEHRMCVSYRVRKGHAVKVINLSPK